MSKKNKKKKKKIVYIDDGRTIADMSGIGGRLPKNPKLNEPVRLRSTLKDRKATYFGAVRMMFVPMLITIGIICAAFGILWLLAKTQV